MARELALACFNAAIHAVDARRAVRRALARDELRGDWQVIAIGKAAGPMTQGAIDALGARMRSGVVISAAGQLPEAVLREPRLQTMVGAHPVPDARSLAAGEAVLEYLQRLPGSAQVLFLISGGASSLIEAPAAGVSLDQLRRLNEWALGSGLQIGAVNALRRRCSRLKGGGLARALGTRHGLALFVSDVPHDDPRVIGSGLLHATPPDRVTDRLPPEIAAIVAGPRTTNGAAIPAVPVRIVASLADARHAAAAHARAAGLHTTVAARRFAGAAATAGRRFARALCALPPSAATIWGGEATVRLPALPGRGGRNQHLALAAALDIAGERGVALLAAGTDGIDGNSVDAGAIVDGASVARIGAAGLDARSALACADSGAVLEASGDLLYTGPTGTNVGDLVIAIRGGARQ